jgi:hypothetical protein
MLTDLHNLLSLHTNLFSLSPPVFTDLWHGSYKRLTEPHTLNITALQHSYSLQITRQNLHRLSSCTLLCSWFQFAPPAYDWITTAEQSRAEQSSSLLLATSQHGHSWHRAPLGPMAIYLFCVKTFVFFFFFRCSSFDKREGLGFFCNWCSLTTPIPPEVTLK